jgi:hypothetical protein
VRGGNVAPLALLPQLFEREVHLHLQLSTPWCVSVREDAATVLSEELIVCKTLLRFQQFRTLVPVDFAKRGVDRLGWVASIAQVVVECSTLLEPDGWVARVCQQSVHLGLEPASKDVSSIVGSVGQIRVGRTGFTVKSKSADPAE